MAAEVLVLLALLTRVHADTFINRGASHAIPLDKSADFCSISRVVGGETQLLWNSSVLHDNGTDSKVLTPHQLGKLNYSDSGRYRVQCWTQGNVTHERNFTLLVCDYQKIQRANVLLRVGETQAVTCDGARPDQDVQWISRRFNRDTQAWDFSVIGGETLVVNKIKAATSNSALLVTADAPGFTASFDCVGMRQQECGLVRRVKVDVLSEFIYRSVAESLELNCSVGGTNPTKWKMDNAVVGGEEETYNSTLVIPSLTLAHQGAYKCELDFNEDWTYTLIVCPAFLPPAVVFFSGGENLTLQCEADSRDFTYWFMKSNRSAGKAVYVFNYYPTYEKLSLSGMTLEIWNVSVEDGGEFWCAAVEDDLCVSSAKTLVVYRDAASVHLIVRSVLISVLVTLMSVVVAVVVWRTWSPEGPEEPEEPLSVSGLLESPVQ